MLQKFIKLLTATKKNPERHGVQDDTEKYPPKNYPKSKEKEEETMVYLLMNFWSTTLALQFSKRRMCLKKSLNYNQVLTYQHNLKGILLGNVESCEIKHISSVKSGQMAEQASQAEKK